jgi:hypothetical protein
MFRTSRFATAFVLAACGLAAGASAQTSALRLNAIWRNPAGNNDNKFQFIGLHGPANQSLAGLAILVIIDDGSNPPEVDESFVFDLGTESYQTNDCGNFVLWSTSGSKSDPLSTQADSTHSGIYQLLPASIKVQDTQSPIGTLNNADFVGSPLSNVITRHEASFQEVGNNPAGNPTGTISSNGSMSVLLIDMAHAKAGGLSFSNADVQKDVVWDANDDGVPETKFQGMSVIDQMAVSDGGGHEYTVDMGGMNKESFEIDFSPGFNADAFVRLNDISPINPGGNGTIKDDQGGTSDDYRSAYTNWAYGEISSTTAPLDFVQGFGAVHSPGAGNIAHVWAKTSGGHTADIARGGTSGGALTLLPGTSNETYSVDTDSNGTVDSSGSQINVINCGHAIMINPDNANSLPEIAKLGQDGDIDGMFRALNRFFSH